MVFTEKDFDKLRNFQKRMEQEFGESAYVGTDHATVVVEYSPELKAMIRPLPPEKHFAFELKVLGCRDCKVSKQAFLCLPDQVSYVCDKCLTKRKKPEKLPEVKPE